MRQSKYFNKLVFVTAPSLSTFSRSLITIVKMGEEKRNREIIFTSLVIILAAVTSVAPIYKKYRAGLKWRVLIKLCIIGDWAASNILKHTYLQQ